MFCKQCGTRNDAGSKFCQACGTTISVPGQNHAVNPEELRRGRAVVEPQSSARHQGPERHDEENNKRKKNPLIILIGILSLVLVLLVGWVFMGQQTTRAFNDAMEAGNRYLLAMNLEQAEVHFLRAIEIKPREVEPYLQLAEIYMTWDEPEEAIAILEQGLEAVLEIDRPALEAALDEINEMVRGEPPADDNIIEMEEEEVPRFRVEWVLEPSIEADDINYVRMNPQGHSFGTGRLYNSVNETAKQFHSPYAVIRRGEALSLIDNNGNQIGLMEHNGAVNMWGTYQLQFINPPPPGPVGMPRHELENGQLVDSISPSGTWMQVIFYYYQGLQYSCMMNEILGEMVRPSEPIPVAQTRSLYTRAEGPLHFWYDANADLYGVFYQGNMITDFMYTRMGSYSEGLLAVERDGRWGYINPEGEVIIPVEFDASWTDFTAWDPFFYSAHFPFAYAASEGFVPLVRDGAWEMRTITNEQVIEPGVFEAIRPMIDGRSWVKYNGLWGIIEIIENEGARTAETEESTDLDLYAMYREVFERNREIAGLQYGFYDIDENGIPELILYWQRQEGVEGRAGIAQIYTWSDGRVIPLLDEFYLGQSDLMGIHIYDTGVIKKAFSRGPRGHLDLQLYQINITGDEIELISTFGEYRSHNFETQTTDQYLRYNDETGLTAEEWHAAINRYTNTVANEFWQWETNINVLWLPMP